MSFIVSSNYYIILVAIILSTSASILQPAVGSPCILEALNTTTGADSGALCTTHFLPTNQTFWLQDCKANDNKDKVTTKCNDVLAQERYCFLHIEIKHFISYADLIVNNRVGSLGSQCANNKNKIAVHIHLISVDISSKNGTRLFNEYPKDHVVTNLNLRSVKINDDMKMEEFCNFQFGTYNQVRFLHFQDMKLESHLPDVGDRFETISIHHSLVPKVRKFAFKMGKEVLKRVEMIGVEMLDEKGFEEDAFTLAATNCRNTTNTYEIILRNMGLKHEVIKSNLVRDFWESTCNGMLTLNISITGNVFDRIIPESVFRHLFVTSFKRPLTSLMFEFDPIDCCGDINKWIFPLIFDNHNRTSGINIECLDLSLPLIQLNNQTQLDEACYRRNNFPIYMIAVISILLFALLLGIFSFVCIYHILPHKNQEIMLKNNNTNSDVMASSGEADRTKASSAIEAKSTQTELPGTSVPLMSKSVASDHNKANKLFKGIKSPNKQRGWTDLLDPNSSGAAHVKTLRSSKQQSPTSLQGKDIKKVESAKKELNLNKMVYKLPGYKNREGKHHKKGKHHDHKPPRQITRDHQQHHHHHTSPPTVANDKKRSNEKSPQSPLNNKATVSKERSPKQATSKGSTASPTPPIRPPSQPVVLPNPIKGPESSSPVASTATEKTATGRQQSKTPPESPDASSVKTSARKSNDDGMSLAFKTINI